MSYGNQTQTGSRGFFKLKEFKEIGEYRFFKQEKVDGKWQDGEAFNNLSGTVTGIDVTEYEYQGVKKKQLVVKLTDVADKMEFSCGLAALVAQSVLNTLAGDNGFDLSFTCGKPKNSNGKNYPTLYINAGEARERTNWKWQPNELPKLVTETYKGVQVKTGQEEVEKFWLEAVDFVKDLLGGNAPKQEVKEEDSSDLAF